jgi:hypothetical protein
MTSEDEEALRKSLMRMEQHTAVPSGPRSAVGTRLDAPFLLKKPKPPLLLSAGYKRKMWLVGEMFVGDSGAALRSYWLAHVRGGRFEVCLHVACESALFINTFLMVRTRMKMHNPIKSDLKWSAELMYNEPFEFK